MAMFIPHHEVEIAVAAASQERFHLWVIQYGTTRLGRAVGMSRKSVAQWFHKSCNRRSPNVETVRKILALSAIEPLADGPLRYEDVFGTVELVSQAVSRREGFGRANAGMCRHYERGSN